MNPLELLQLQKNRDRIIKAAARELHHVQMMREQLHIDVILRRLDDLERRLAAVAEAPPPHDPVPKVSIITRRW